MGKLFQKLSEAVFAFNEKVKELWGKFVEWVSLWWDPFIKKLIINKSCCSQK